MNNSADIREIAQGDIYWLQLDSPEGTAQSVPHPYVVVQNDAITHSRIHSVAVCGLSTNPKRANEPGNILLETGEANLQKQSVVVVSHVSLVNKTQLVQLIGALSKTRVEQILAGMRFQQRSYFRR